MKLFMGVGIYKLDIKNSKSLKDKRRLVKSVLERLGNSRTMAASEVGENDLCKSASLAVACFSPSHGDVDRLLNKARELIESSGVEVTDEDRWILNPYDI